MTRAFFTGDAFLPYDPRVECACGHRFDIRDRRCPRCGGEEFLPVATVESARLRAERARRQEATR